MVGEPRGDECRDAVGRRCRRVLHRLGARGEHSFAAGAEGSVEEPHASGVGLVAPGAVHQRPGPVEPGGVARDLVSVDRSGRDLHLIIEE